jgi:radical SAM superfamily enzyme YgiQ (UPF0313 family)
MKGQGPVVLYQPRGEGHALPLGLVHVGSMAPDAHVVVVDGRVELAPETQVAELGRQALCLGVSVLTGPPIADALRVSRGAKARNPELRVIWGGRHPSLMPEQCLASGVVDACVVGQGERTFLDLLKACAEGRSFEGIRGVVTRRGQEAVRHPPRAFEDVNGFPAADFGLLEMERYFRSRGARRLDYCSSQSATFDPTGVVVSPDGRPRWSGLSAERVVGEIGDLAGRYRVTDVSFSDEDFFADLARAEAIGRGFIAAGVRVRWSGAGRADVLCRLSDDKLRLLRASGCSRVRVDLAGRDPALLPEGEECVLLPEVIETADKLHRAGIGARFSFIAGCPHDSKKCLARTYRAAKAVRQIDGEFDTPILFYAPYSGMVDPARMPAMGITPPRTLEDWEKLGPTQAVGPWIPKTVRRFVPRYNFYLRHGYRKPSRRLGKRLLHYFARARAKTNFYRFDFERRAVDLSSRLRGGVDRRRAKAED